MPSLKDLIGKEIFVSIPIVDSEGYIFATLLAIEDAGLWLQCDFLSEKFMSDKLLSEGEKKAKPKVFFPFSEIHYVLDFSD
jgi:hypothetical protein